MRRVMTPRKETLRHYNLPLQCALFVLGLLGFKYEDAVSRTLGIPEWALRPIFLLLVVQIGLMKRWSRQQSGSELERPLKKQ